MRRRSCPSGSLKQFLAPAAHRGTSDLAQFVERRGRSGFLVCYTPLAPRFGLVCHSRCPVGHARLGLQEVFTKKPAFDGCTISWQEHIKQHRFNAVHLAATGSAPGSSRGPLRLAGQRRRRRELQAGRIFRCLGREWSGLPGRPRFCHASVRATW